MMSACRWPGGACRSRSAEAVDDALERAPCSTRVLELEDAGIVTDTIPGRPCCGTEVEIVADAGEENVAEHREVVDAESCVLDLVGRADINRSGYIAVRRRRRRACPRKNSNRCEKGECGK